MIQNAPVDVPLLGALCPMSPQGPPGELGCLIAQAGPTMFAVFLLLAGAAGVGLYLRRRERGDEPDAMLLFLEPGTARVDRGGEPRAEGTSTRFPDPRTGGEATASRPDRAAPRPGAGGSGVGASADARPAVAEGGALAPPASAGGNGSPPRPEGLGSTGPEIEEAQEGTLQLLPGRIEIRSGDPGKEIRFVRVPGVETEVTFGRSVGAPHRHVQLESATVSRIHARLRFASGRWTLQNESTTNPTLLNSRPLVSPGDRPLLEDGDLIEMGEVVLRFHQPATDDRLPRRSSWYTDPGRRATNQDAVAVRTLPDGREIAVVLDGLGGHAAGKLASHRALEALLGGLEAGQDLQAAVKAANREVLSEAAGSPERAGMGTTLVALLRDGTSYQVANVGDSRAYRIDGSGIRQLTVDHSFLAEVVQNGGMSMEEANHSPWRNAVTRHLGADRGVEVDLFGPFPTDEAHLVLLCSDGACSVLSDEEIEALVREAREVTEMAKGVGEAALRAGTDDNVTVAVVQFGQGLARGAHAPEPTALPPA